MKTTSHFVLQATELDACFSDLQRLSSQIEDADLDSDTDFQLAVKLLTKFTERAMNLEEVVQKFAKSLEETQQASNHAVKAVAEKAQLIQQRKDKTNALQEKLNTLGIRVRGVVSGMTQLRNENGEPNEQQKTLLAQELGNVRSQIEVFIEEAGSIKNEAHAHKFKEILSSADSLQATLQNAKDKLSSVAQAL